MPDIDKLVEKFKAKLNKESETEKYKNEVVLPLIDSVFNNKFASVFRALADELNKRLGFDVLKVFFEGKNRFTVQGRYHRVYFQKGKVELSSDLAIVNIIPIYMWKGVTKHLGPISFGINLETKEVNWDLPFKSVGDYAENIYAKLVDDVDFFM